MKRYLAFSGSQYYPSGGWEDVLASYDTLAEAEAACRERASDYFEWWHIVDTDKMTIVREGSQ